MSATVSLPRTLVPDRERMRILMHELRTPLAVIQTAMQIVRRREHLGDDAMRAAVASVGDSVDRLRRMVEDLETVLIGSPSATTSQSSRLSDVLDHCIAQRPLELRVSPTVVAEQHLLPIGQRAIQRVLHHLIDNAEKFSPVGSPVRVTCDVRPDTISIAVEDRGVGIPGDAMPRIFEPFFQADGSDTRAFEGLGLGLTVARQLVQAAGGTLSCTSAPGEGSIFTVSLPRLNAADLARPHGRSGRIGLPTWAG